MLSTDSLSATSRLRARESPPARSRCHHTEGGVKAGDRVADADPDPHRRQVRHARRMVAQMAQPADRFANHAERGLVAIGPVLPVAGDMGDDEIFARAAQRLRAEAEARQLARPEVLHHRVAFRGETKHDVLRLRVLQIDGNTALVAAVLRPPGRIAVDMGAPLPDRIAGRRFDLDHVGAQIAEQPRTERRGDEMADFQNAQAGERPGPLFVTHNLQSRMVTPSACCRAYPGP